MPGGEHLNAFTRLNAAREVLHQALRERHQRRNIRQGGEAIAIAHLNSAVTRNRANIPTVLARIVNHIGRHERLQVVAVLLPGIKVEGQTVRRKLLIKLGAVRSVTGIDSIPVGGRTGKRQQVRTVVGQRVNERQNLITGVNAYVHVHAVNDHVAAPILGALDHTLVAFLRHDRLVCPVGEGVSAGGVELNAELIGNVTQGIRQILQLTARLSDGAADAGHHLEGVLQEFAGHVRPVGGGLEQFGAALAQDGQHLAGALGQFAAFTVDKCNLPFHAESGLRGGSKVDHMAFPASGNRVVHGADYGSYYRWALPRAGASSADGLPGRYRSTSSRHCI